MIGIYGARRIGKTSLLQHMNRPEFDSRIATVFIDTQEMLPAIHNDSGFYSYLEEKLLCETSGVSGDRSAGSPGAVRAALERARSTAHPKRIVLLIDELENLQYKFDTNTLSRDIPIFLASLLEGQAPLSFVISGSNQEQLVSDTWRVLNPKITFRRIGILGLRDATRLVVEPMNENGVSLDDRLVSATLRNSGRHPYYTQLICRMLVDELNQERRYVLQPAHLERALSLVLDSPPAPLTYVWKSFKNPMLRLACSAFAFALESPDEAISTEIALQKAPIEAVKLVQDRVALQVAVDQLEQEEWLEVDRRGRYKFRIDLFRTWLRRYHSIWQTTSELVSEGL
jgi:hypothetical protein